MGLGIQYGMYQSFRKNTEVRLAEHAGEISTLKSGFTAIQSELKVLQNSVVLGKEENHKDLKRIEESIERLSDSIMKYLFEKSR